MENRLYPMRELVGDLLMAQGAAGAALMEYETSLKNAPMRLRGFYGAAKAAEASGDPKKARVLRETRLAHAARGRRSAGARRGETTIGEHDEMIGVTTAIGYVTLLLERRAESSADLAT